MSTPPILPYDHPRPPFTYDHICAAIDVGIDLRMCGLCYWFDQSASWVKGTDTYRPIPKYLRQLGARFSGDDYAFSPNPELSEQYDVQKDVFNQRLMMLAFMLTWEEEAENGY